MMALRPMEVLGTLEAAGLTASLTPDFGLMVSPASLLTDELRSLIRAHKAALVDLFKRQAAADQAEVEREMIEERAAIMQFDAGMERDLAERMARLHTAYLMHHWRCSVCCVAGHGRGHRCEIGSSLWNDYQVASDEADAARTRRNSK